MDDVKKLLEKVAKGEITPEEAIAQYQAEVGDLAQQIVDELNAQ